MNLSDQITLTVRGETPEQVATLLIAIAKALGGDAIEHIALAEDAPEAKVTLAKSTKRTKKEEADPKPEAEAKPALNSLKEKTPGQARDEAVKLMQDHFAKNPHSMPEISKLQTKYGVRKFQEIDDARAVDLLADVMLLIAGAFDE